MSAADGGSRVGIVEGANIIGVSPYTLRRWINQKRLPFYKLGRRVLLSRDDLEQFIEAGRVDQRPAIGL